MANKMKVVDKFMAVKALLSGDKVENFSIKDAVAFIDERITITENKNAKGGERKPTATQVENEGIKSDILAVLSSATEPMTIDDIRKATAELSAMSCQKVSALLTQLRKANAIVRTEVKGKAYFALATEE
jgi:hypothetical protein